MDTVYLVQWRVCDVACGSVFKPVERPLSVKHDTNNIDVIVKQVLKGEVI